MYFRVVDFETSGDAPDGELIEVGWWDISQAGHVCRGGSALVKPERSVSVETMAVHHLTARELQHGVGRDEALAALKRFPKGEALDLFGKPDLAFVAHSAKFEQEWWPESKSQPWICTYKCAVRLWPDSPRHSNQVLRYHLGLDLPPSLAMPPHRAAPDAYVTAHILLKMLQQATPQELIEWSSKPALLPRVTFGKNTKGMRWQDVDSSFLYWVVERDFDEDVLYTAHHEIERREAEERGEPASEELAHA